MIRLYLRSGALAIVLFWTASLSAQTPTLSCRPLQPGNTYIDADEKVIGNQACKIVTNATPAQKQPSAYVQPTSVPVTSAPANPGPAPAVQARATTDTKSDPTPNPPETSTPVSDGKTRLYVTDEPKDESVFLAAHRSGWQVHGESSGQVSGSFVNGTGSVQGSSSGSVRGSGGSSGAAYGYSEKGGDPRTVELEADLYKSCPSIVVTNDPARGDYVLLFRRQGGKRSQMFIFGGLTGLALSAHSKVDGASVFDKNGDMVYATRERTVGKAIKEVCSHLK